MRAWLGLVALTLLAGCTLDGSSTSVSFSGGSGDFEGDLDCAGSARLVVEIDATSGDLFFAVLDGDDQPAIVYDHSDGDLQGLDTKLSGASGNWKLGGAYQDMDGSGRIRLSC